MDTDTLKRICQNGSVTDLTARKAVRYAEIGSAANLAYHFGLCQALMKEAFVTCDQIGPLAVLRTTAIDGVNERVVCHHPGAPYSISPSSRTNRIGLALANSGNLPISISSSIGICETFSASLLAYMYGV